MGDSQYSFSLTTFSPSGKLVQIEHALTAVGSGQTSLGIKGRRRNHEKWGILISREIFSWVFDDAYQWCWKRRDLTGVKCPNEELSMLRWKVEKFKERREEVEKAIPF
ncbi:Proteasome subunit alpha type-2-A [Bienertia sinuspersici]